MPRLRSFVRLCALFMLITGALIPLSWLPAPWTTWRPATCLPAGCFCETMGTGFIRQPIDTWSKVGYVLFNLALAISLIVMPELRRYLFGGLLVVTMGLEVLLRQRRRNRVSLSDRELANESRNLVSGRVRYFIAALLIYVLAQFIWTLDLSHIVCGPNSLLQGHAIWHILTAISAGLLYFYYRSVVAFDG